MHRRISQSSKIIRSRPSVIALGFISGFGVGVADYLTDVEMSLVIFYLVPVAFVTWYAGPKGRDSHSGSFYDLVIDQRLFSCAVPLFVPGHTVLECDYAQRCFHDRRFSPITPQDSIGP